MTFKKGAVLCVVTLVIITYFSHQAETRISEAGLEVLANAENCTLNAYKCPANVWTNGVGNTSNVDPKKILTINEVVEDLKRNVRSAEDCVNSYANGAKLPQGAFDALTSITFNVGCEKLKNSTLFKMARKGYSVSMCNQFERWIYSNGKPLKGLISRREKEKALCLKDS